MVFFTTQSPLTGNRVIVAPVGRSARHLTKNRATLVCRRGGFRFRKNNQAFRLSIDLPGVKARDLKVKVEDGILHISGHRKEKGEFSKMYAVKSFDASKLKANLSDGVLTLTAPRFVTDNPQTIPVTKGSHPEHSDEQFQLSIDVPGVKADDVNVELKDGRLTVVAERKIKKDGDEVTMSKLYNEFSVNPNEVETSQIKAVLESGVLMLFGPKKNNGNEQTIPVTQPDVESVSDKLDETEDHNEISPNEMEEKQ